MAYSLNGSERETIICFSEDEETATLYTASPVWMRKLDRLSAEHSEFFREQEDLTLDQQELCALVRKAEPGHVRVLLEMLKELQKPKRK